MPVRILIAIASAVALAACGAPTTPPPPDPAELDVAPAVVVHLDRDQLALVEIGGGYAVKFEPHEHGWYLTVLDLQTPGPDLSCITPPRMGPNPRDLAGWHLRNASNTGPNAPGPDNVNAPGTERTVYFASQSWLVDPTAQCALGPAAVPPEALGTLAITLDPVTLTPPAADEQAAFEHATVRITAVLPR